MPRGSKKTPAKPAPKLTKAQHAMIKDALPAHAGEETVMAPRGDYEIEDCGHCVGLCHCATKNRFTLSFDAFLQHLSEGRIAVAR
ncbi:MAG: hypothetical protein R3C60_06380 [Parvularculaceae bacterium]